MLRSAKRVHVRASLPSRLQQSVAFSISSRRNGYEDTIQNLKIGKDTRVIFQGFTGMVHDGLVVQLQI